MLQGTIQNVIPPDHQDQYGNHYQNITVIDGAGMPHQGRIASKTPYTQQDVGKQGQWDVEQKQSSQGPYQKFKRHYDKPYGGQQGSYQGQQPPQHAAGRPKGDDMVRVRSMALAYAKDLVVADKIVQAGLPTTANEFTSFIMTGQWFKDNQPDNQPQGTQTNPDYVGDDPQPPRDDDIPF